ncbi:MAG: acetyl-CoA carboxylase biotin carboxyl carrier protein subunit [Terriglobales bacterium]
MNATVRFEIQIGETLRLVELRGEAISVDGEPLAADAVRIGECGLSLLLEGRSFTFRWARLADGSLWLGSRGGEVLAQRRDPRQALVRGHAQQTGRVRIAAPMAGKVVRVIAAVGEALARGQALLVLEAMKMQNEVRAPKSGTLIALAVAPGDTVATAQLLAEIE